MMQKYDEPDDCGGGMCCHTDGDYYKVSDVIQWKRDLLSDILETLNNHHVDDNIDYIEDDVINMCIRRLGD